MLLRRKRVPVMDAVERLVALQAQVPRDPYVALWSRLDRFRPERLAERIEARDAVRMTLLRGTLHLVAAADALTLRPIVRPVIERTLRGQRAFRTAADGLDLDELTGVLRTLLEERPRTRAELASQLAERWPDRDAGSLAYWMHMLPTVQVTPRGVWGRSGRSAFTTIERWLGRPPDRGANLDELVTRYLAAYGPATPADAQTWSGIPGMAEVFERLGAGLRIVRDEDGRELFDLPGAPLPDPATPAPVRFLPEFDNALLSHKDRARIVPPGVPPWTEAGWGAVLVDGFVCARWKVQIEGEDAELRIESFGRLSREDRTAVEAEGTSLLGLLARGAPVRRIRTGRVP